MTTEPPNETPSAADLRALVREAVLARRPVDARERWSIDEFVRRFDSLASPFDEHADTVHVTASAIVTSDDGRRVLLHRHKRLQMWLQPGGHIEAGETPWQGALREAAESRGSWRLDGCTLVVTLEPCPMCAGAVVMSRIDRLVFGAWNDEYGAAGSRWDLVRDRRLNHRAEVTGGVREADCSAILREFMAAQRSAGEGDA